MYKPFAVKHYKQYYRIFTHLFLHGDPMHLIFNMIALYSFGTAIEGLFQLLYGMIPGSLIYLVLFFGGGLFATLIPYARHKDHEFYRSLGASGAVSAVLFAFIMVAPTSSISIFFIPQIPAYIFGPLYLAFEFWADRNGKTNIAHDAHIGGALFGILFILITNIELVKTAFNSVF